MTKPPTIEAICRAHGKSRQAFYRMRDREKQRTGCEDIAVRLVTEERKQQPRMGTRKLYKEFIAAFKILKIGRDKLFDMLRRRGLLVRRRRRAPGTTHWWHSLRRYDNLTAAFKPSRPNELWVSDMTYIPVEDGFAYASIITDAFSRKIVGYRLEPTLEAIGPHKALQQALKGVDSTDGLIHHSDQGVQYCSKMYVETLKKHGCRVSMTSGGRPSENALAERVNGTLKNEYLMGEGFNSFERAREALADAVQLYNERRPHLSLAYEKPADVHERGYVKAA